MVEDIEGQPEEVSDGHIPGPDRFQMRLLCWEAAWEMALERDRCPAGTEVTHGPPGNPPDDGRGV